MKFKGKSLQIHEYTTITLPRKISESITIRVNSIPLGLKRDFEVMCPRPKPPFKMVVTKGKETREENWEDINYIAEIQDYRDLERYYILYVALKGNPDLVIENEPKDVNSLRAFRDEMKSAGFSEGDARLILDASMAASNVSDKDISEARETF